MKTIRQILHLCAFALITNIAKCENSPRISQKFSGLLQKESDIHSDLRPLTLNGLSLDSLTAMMAVLARKSDASYGQWTSKQKEKLDAVVLKEDQLEKWKKLVLAATTDGLNYTDVLKDAAEDLNVDQKRALEELYNMLTQSLMSAWGEELAYALLKERQDQVNVMLALYLSEKGFDLTNVELSDQQQRDLQSLATFLKIGGQFEKLNKAIYWSLYDQKLHKYYSLYNFLLHETTALQRWIIAEIDLTPQQEMALRDIIKKELHFSTSELGETNLWEEVRVVWEEDEEKGEEEKTNKTVWNKRDPADLKRR